METKIIEATDGTEFNWGKFLIGRFTDEWTRRSALPMQLMATDAGNETRTPLLRQIGWSASSLLVLDLQTGEGCIVRPGGNAHADLNKHRVWVCPMFEPFLAWLYKQDMTNLVGLPAFVNLGDVPTSLAGYRRAGPVPDDASNLLDSQT